MSCSYSYLPSQKTYKEYEQDMQDTAGEARTSLISSFLLLLQCQNQGPVSVARPARTYLHQRCAGTGCSLEDQLGAMDDRDTLIEGDSLKSVLSAQLDDDNGLAFQSASSEEFR